MQTKLGIQDPKESSSNLDGQGKCLFVLLTMLTAFDYPKNYFSYLLYLLVLDL